MTSSGKSVVSSSLSSSTHSGAHGRRLEAYRDVPRDDGQDVCIPRKGMIYSANLLETSRSAGPQTVGGIPQQNSCPQDVSSDHYMSSSHASYAAGDTVHLQPAEEDLPLYIAELLGLSEDARGMRADVRCAYLSHHERSEVSLPESCTYLCPEPAVSQCGWLCTPSSAACTMYLHRRLSPYLQRNRVMLPAKHKWMRSLRQYGRRGVPMHMSAN